MAMRRIGIITSGGDAPGMNAAIRAITRCALDKGIGVVGIHEGWQGVLEGGDHYEPFNWRSVGGILQLGGTILGTARSDEFRTIEGRRQACLNLLQAEIDGLVVIGGDGSLTGALYLQREWSDHVKALVERGSIPSQPGDGTSFCVVGLPGTIDNDLYGTDMSIGADTALHTIVEAIDRLSSTANAHQRTFVVETMGRRSGYLALMSAVATGADWVLIPEEEMDTRWHYRMVDALKLGRAAGRRHDIVILAEGARHSDGLPIRAETIAEILHSRMDIEARVTVLGHVQRGGSPSAFDRVLATRLGGAAVDHLVSDAPVPVMIGLLNNQTMATPLEDAIEKSRTVNSAIDQGQFDLALELRGRSFRDSLHMVKTMARAAPKEEISTRGRIAMLTGGPDSPGMNAILRTILRYAMNSGQDVIGIEHGFGGLVRGEMWDLQWMDVQQWMNLGGSELGAVRYTLTESDLGGVIETIRNWDIRGLIAVGGLDTYIQVARLKDWAADHPELRIPIVCVPATIDNNLPATEMTIGADTALNNIIDAVDKIKYTAGAAQRAFIVEVMGRQCGYLALTGGIASGAEMELLPEDNVTLEMLHRDVERLREGFRGGKKLGIVIRAEGASAYYDTGFVRRVMESESDGAFDVRQSILGHLQRGGVPTAFDRIQGSRLGVWAARQLMEDMAADKNDAWALGLQQRGIEFTALADAMAEMDWEKGRPIEQAFLHWRELADTLAKPGPGWQWTDECEEPPFTPEI